MSSRLEGRSHSLPESSDFFRMVSIEKLTHSLDLRIQMAMRDKLDFYAPRYFEHANLSYRKMNRVRRIAQAEMDIRKYAQLTIYHLDKAQITKSEVYYQLPQVLVLHRELEDNAVFSDYPNEFEDIEDKLAELIEIVELKQVSPQSWALKNKTRLDKLSMQLVIEMQKLKSNSLAKL